MAASMLNFNVGVLGHVDSGKTSLSKALSTVASTASFDKNPQSKERGITLDLGFSSFQVDVPEHVGQLALKRVQYTLVDCPGHASLIKTIIGGKLFYYIYFCAVYLLLIALHALSPGLMMQNRRPTPYRNRN